MLMVEVGFLESQVCVKVAGYLQITLSFSLSLDFFLSKMFQLQHPIIPETELKAS